MEPNKYVDLHLPQILALKEARLQQYHLQKLPETQPLNTETGLPYRDLLVDIKLVRSILPEENTDAVNVCSSQEVVYRRKRDARRDARRTESIDQLTSRYIKCPYHGIQ